MKIDGHNPNQPLTPDDLPSPSSSQPGSLSRWNGVPGTPGPSRVSSDENVSNIDSSIAKLSQREPAWSAAELSPDPTFGSTEELHNWLAASPENMNRYVDDHMMDALLENHFRTR